MTALPRYVSGFRDRHGKQRYRFRRGKTLAYLYARAGTQAFEEEYRRCLAGDVVSAAARAGGVPIAALVTQAKEYLDRWNLPLKGEYVYFVWSAAGHIKIGYSCGIISRLGSLTTGSHNRLRLIGLLPGSKRVEAAWHSRFEHLRTSGEWFRSTAELRVAIRLEHLRTLANLKRSRMSNRAENGSFPPCSE